MNVSALLNPIQAGFVADEPYAAYDCARGVRQGALEVMASRCPAACRWAIEHQSSADTDALRVGRCFHEMLTGDEKNVAICPLESRRGTAWKEWATEFTTADYLMLSEVDEVRAMLESVRSHPIAGELLRMKRRRELSCYWNDKETGLACKARFDWVARWADVPVILDIKTARSASEDSFSKAMASYGYHRKAAWYLEGAYAIDPRQRGFIYVVIEKEPPYLVALYEVDSAALAQGKQENRNALRRLAWCIKENQWPGYADQLIPLGLPRWAQKQEMDNGGE